jgi:hypothetical protein
MTTLTVNDSEMICRAKLTREGHWVSLALSLADLSSANRFLVSAERLLYEMWGTDYEAAHYSLLNWQGGIISGARYTFRALKSPIKQVCLHEFRGRLGSEDVWAVSAAASLVVARLLGRPEVPLELGDWQVEAVHRGQPAEDGNGSTKVVSPERQPPQARGDIHSPTSEKAGSDQAGQANPAEPGAAADGGGM